MLEKSPIGEESTTDEEKTPFFVLSAFLPLFPREGETSPIFRGENINKNFKCSRKEKKRNISIKRGHIFRW